MKKVSILILGVFAYISFEPSINALVLCPASSDGVASSECLCRAKMGAGSHGVSKYINGSCNYSCEDGYNLTSSNTCVPTQPAPVMVESLQPIPVVIDISQVATTTNQTINLLEAEVKELKNRIETLESQKITPIAQPQVSKPEVVKPIEKKAVPVQAVQPKATSTPIKTIESKSVQEEVRPIEVPVPVKKKNVISRFFSFFF